MHKFFRAISNTIFRSSLSRARIMRLNHSDDVGRLFDELLDVNWVTAQYGNLDIDMNEIGTLLKSGVDPCPYFDSDWYLFDNKDLSDLEIDPLLHYVTFGEKEGRKPNPLFDPLSYLQNYPNLDRYEGTLLSHYINFGIKQGRVAAKVDNTAEFKAANDLARENLKKFENIFSVKKIAVVIPVYNNWQYTERCIRAIEKTIDYEALQIYIVNDGSTDGTLQELQRFPDVKVINHNVHSGYIKACNFAFLKLAAYDFLFLLNNDLEPNSGFVLNAMEVMQSNDDAAIVGSTLFSPDGKVKAAGGMVGHDGTCLHWGDLNTNKDSQYRYTRKIDYVPLAAALIRNTCLQEVNGFDERYVPDHYEDVDLAFQMRQIGKSVYVSSESTVFHCGSKSNSFVGANSLIGMISTNKEKFRKKWQLTLESESYTQSRRPLEPYIGKNQNYIEWTPSQIRLALSHEFEFDLMKSGMSLGYQFIYKAHDFHFDALNVSKFRNSGIQVVTESEEVDQPSHSSGGSNVLWKSVDQEIKYEQIKDEIFFEAKNANFQAKRIAVLAHWSVSEQMSYSTEKLIQELLNCNYEVLLVSTCESRERLVLSPRVHNKITIIRKPNRGYDFGSWSIGLQTFPEIKFADEVLLINDTLAGPFEKLDNILDKARSSPFDITGLCDSIQIKYHIQSFFFHFKNGSLMNQTIWTFWCNVGHFDKKDDLIHQYELGFTELAAKELRLGALFPFNLSVDRFGASTLSSAKTFLELGNPFLKMGVIRSLSLEQSIELRDLVRAKFDLEEFEVNDFFGHLTHDSID